MLEAINNNNGHGDSSVRGPSPAVVQEPRDTVLQPLTLPRAAAAGPKPRYRNTPKYSPYQEIMAAARRPTLIVLSKRPMIIGCVLRAAAPFRGSVDALAPFHATPFTAASRRHHHDGPPGVMFQGQPLLCAPSRRFAVASSAAAVCSSAVVNSAAAAAAAVEADEQMFCYQCEQTKHVSMMGPEYNFSLYLSASDANIQRGS